MGRDRAATGLGNMTEWQRWHEDYDDPESDLSRRLAVVQRGITTWIDDAPAGPLRLISMCAGQGHDVVGALRRHRRRGDLDGLLVERDEVKVAAARHGLQEAGLSGVTAVVGDAAKLAAYSIAAPADLLLVCGVFGNISDEDVQQTIAALPMLAHPGATMIWTRHRRAPDLTEAIRGWLETSGFAEVDFSSPGPDRFAVGTHRFVGDPPPFVPAAAPLFTFRG